MNCKPVVAGKQYDFTGLINSTGSYQFTGTVNNTNFIFQFQMCGNVANPLSKACPPSPVLQMTADLTSCWSLGDSNVYAWDQSPSQNGIMLQMYHGDTLNDIERRSSIVYISCSRSPAPIFFEHERVCFDSVSGNQLGGQYHFAIKSKLAC